MDSTPPSRIVEQEEPLEITSPSENVFLVTIHALVPSAPPMGEVQVIAVLRDAIAITDMLHTGAWITTTTHDRDGSYVTALPDSDVQPGLDMQSVADTGRLTVHANADASSAYLATMGLPPTRPGDAQNGIFALRGSEISISMSGDTAREASLAGSTQVGSTVG
ncbi:hypothetical protein NX059_010974 [Plenodomus lindquistii]|nr:hypothetical protein NX059_010974 [Plenodomus lindquistii]